MIQNFDNWNGNLVLLCKGHNWQKENDNVPEKGTILLSKTLNKILEPVWPRQKCKIWADTCAPTKATCFPGSIPWSSIALLPQMNGHGKWNWNTETGRQSWIGICRSELSGRIDVTVQGSIGRKTMIVCRSGFVPLSSISPSSRSPLLHRSVPLMSSVWFFTELLFYFGPHISLNCLWYWIGWRK